MTKDEKERLLSPDGLILSEWKEIRKALKAFEKEIMNIEKDSKDALVLAMFIRGSIEGNRFLSNLYSSGLFKYPKARKAARALVEPFYMNKNKTMAAINCADIILLNSRIVSCELLLG